MRPRTIMLVEGFAPSCVVVLKCTTQERSNTAEEIEGARVRDCYDT